MKFFPNPEDDEQQLKKNLEFEKIFASDNDIVWDQDTKSYFTIMPFIKENKLMVRVYSTDHKNLYLISGDNPMQIYYKIIKMGLITKLEHAAYLGKELQKAYVALKQKLFFNQDDFLSWDKFIEPSSVEEDVLYKESQKNQVFPTNLREKIIVLNCFSAKHLKQGFIYSNDELKVLAKNLFLDNYSVVIFELINFGFVSHNSSEDDFTVILTRIGFN